jgi:hypothetical protein
MMIVSSQEVLFSGVLHPPSSPHDNPALFTTLSLLFCVLRCTASIKLFLLRVITSTPHDQSSSTTTYINNKDRNQNTKKRKSKKMVLFLMLLLLFGIGFWRVW